MAFDPKLLRKSFSLYEDRERFASEVQRISEEIVSSRYATGHMVDVTVPYDKELFGGRQPKWRKVGTDRQPYDQQHDFDVDGNIRLISNSEYQWIVRTGDNFVEKIGVETERFVLDRESRLVERHRLCAERGSSSFLHWEDNMLQSVVTTSWEHEPPKVAGKPWGDVVVIAVIRQSYFHDDEGLQQITKAYLNDDGSVFSEIGEQNVYTRLPKGVTAASLARSITSMLCEQIPPLVRGAAVSDQRYYCLLICYCNEDPLAGWPPFLLLGNAAMLESEAFPSAERTYFLWAPDELRELPGNLEIALTDEKLHDSCRLHAQVINDVAPIKRVLKQVVKEMQSISWHDTISITDNFVVAAVDNTSEIDQAADIKKYAPEQFRNLRRQNLI